MVLRSAYIFALPMKSTYAKVNSNLKNQIQKIVLEKGVDKTSKELGIDSEYFRRFFKGHRCSIHFLFKIYNYLGIGIKTIENNVLHIASGKNNSVGISNPKFPFKLDTDNGGTLLGAIMGDGSRTKLGGVTYNNQNKELVKKVLRAAQKIFGDVSFRLSKKKDGTLQLDLPKIVGDVVSLVGIKKSYKTASDCYVKLEEFSKTFKINFIRQFFDDEGNVRLCDRRLQIKQTRDLQEDSKERVRGNIAKFSPKVLVEIKKELEKLGIRSTLSLESLRKYDLKTKGDFALNIYCKENLEMFERLVGFYSDRKQRLLKEAIKSYKFPSAPRNCRIEFALKHATSVQSKNGFITKHLLAKESRRSLKTAAYFLVDLKKKGFVTVVERPRGERGAPLPQKYVVSKKPV